MAKERFSEWVKNTLPKLPFEMQQDALLSWNRNTVEAQSKSKKFVPVAVGNLRDSIDTIKAKITSNGIVSAIIARVPYAARIHNDKSLRLKDPGEISYYIAGSPQKKVIKGESEFISKGIDETEDQFIRDLKKVIGKVWKG